MKEIIIKMTADHIKVKGGEYVQDIVRCRDCKHWLEYCSRIDGLFEPNDDDFCSYGEVRR